MTHKRARVAEVEKRPYIVELAEDDLFCRWREFVFFEMVVGVSTARDNSEIG
jgi:hypothetical protein